MRVAYLLVAAALAALPGPESDPRDLLLRASDVPGAAVTNGPVLFEARTVPCEPDRPLSLRPATAASVIIRGPESGVSQGLYLFPAERTAKAAYRRLVARLAACPVRTTRAGTRAAEYQVVVRRTPVGGVSDVGDEVYAFREEFTVPTVGPQRPVTVEIRVGRVLLGLQFPSGVIDEAVLRTAVARAAAA